MTIDIELRCPRCESIVDDLWAVYRNGKRERMCPGCVADCRRRGDLVTT